MTSTKSNKHIFWQAFISAFIIFWTGIMLGILFESSRADKLEYIYFNAETDIFDILIKNEIISEFDLECDIGLKENINFADQIYFEARELEKYDASTQITTEILELHKRYDLLRVMLWKNMIDFQKKCPNETNTVVYIYEYDDPSNNKQAVQITLSRVLLDLKEKYKDDVVLIPIAGDTNVKSLEILKDIYDLTETPIVIINQKHVVKGLTSLSELESYLN